VKKSLIWLATLTAAVGLAPSAAVADPGVAGPTVHITSPGTAGFVTPGEGLPGAGSPNGSGFALNIEAETHDSVGLRVKEALNIRHTDVLGQPNPDFPGLNVTLGNDLTKPDGGVIPAGTNLAALFNIAGTDDTPGPGVTVWAGWHVLESLAPGTRVVVVRVSVTDDAGRTGSTVGAFPVTTAAGRSGQDLTPAPSSVTGDGVDDANGPVVSIQAPETPTSVALGTLPQPTLANGTLFFLQVDALDVFHHGIGVNENGAGISPLGLIVDPTQIGAHGPNRNFPGLEVTFDAALRQPNGNLVPAGQNLAPLFNIAGSEATVGRPSAESLRSLSPADFAALRRFPAVRTTADWVVGGALVLPDGQSTLTITARVTDNAGRTGSQAITVGISPATSGQDLTPAP